MAPGALNDGPEPLPPSGRPDGRAALYVLGLMLLGSLVMWACTRDGWPPRLVPVHPSACGPVCRPVAVP